MKLNKHLKIVGKTTDEKQVVQNGFAMVDTYGLPLEILLGLLKDNHMVMDWVAFFEDAMVAQWPVDRTVIKIETALLDIYGTEYKNMVVRRMKDYLFYKYSRLEGDGS